MAAVIIIAGDASRRRRKTRPRGRPAGAPPQDAEEPRGRTELFADFAGIGFRADIALERVKLEDGLLGFMQQTLGVPGLRVGWAMPLFLLCLMCFLVAISILSPATETSAIHQHLESHFGLGEVAWARDLWGGASPDASHACQIDLGILLCPQTCGYCAPFEYEKLKTFGKPQITLLPSVLYQTRLNEAECHGFAAMVQNQDYNPVLTLLPALDGKKKDQILKCIDRSSQQTSDYALYMDCPEHTPSSKVGVGHKQSFHGDTVYAEMLIESEKVLTSMQKARQRRWFNMMHFFFVFAILFLMLAFMANFLLGGRIHIFSTFGSACSAQVRMLFGEFIYADGVEALTGSALATLAGNVFFTLLNFFLAIIVDAFVEVKDNCGQLRCTQSFFRDLCSMAWTLYLRRRYKLPASKRLVTFLAEGLMAFDKLPKGGEEKFPLFPASSIVTEFGVEEIAVCHWLCWIESLSTVPLVHYHSGDEDNEDDNAVEQKCLGKS
eukprot:Skav206419  [mRNA]  locus=scaffold292:360054:374362:+ [translate_table: standard]